MSIKSCITKTTKKVALKISKHSPEILIVVGVAGAITSTVLACKATLKLDEILEKSKNDLDDIHEAKETIEEYTEKDYKNDIAITYVKTGVSIAKLYAPAITIGTLSVAAILGSHDILKKRNAALASAYALVDRSYKEYRKRVVEELGDDMDRHFKFNTRLEEIETSETDEKGKTKTKKETVEVVDNDVLEYSEYARFFDETCDSWTKDPEYNMTFLIAQQTYWNNKLQQDGYVFLNDVYNSLGMEKSKVGQVAGWVYRPEDKNHDSYISFGLFDNKSKAARRFVNGYENVILLDFNVDGYILDDM